MRSRRSLSSAIGRDNMKEHQKISVAATLQVALENLSRIESILEQPSDFHEIVCDDVPVSRRAIRFATRCTSSEGSSKTCSDASRCRQRSSPASGALRRTRWLPRIISTSSRHDFRRNQESERKRPTRLQRAVQQSRIGFGRSSRMSRSVSTSLE